ncbi:MAG TPA: hypothetical protein VNV36_00230 [Pseudomonas sp.]|uniref:hypothetical protein n=1 Tax=Pseudomonas sp. TaxID=306 RepID=UPI002C389DAF|nr:hypothetical protein [Pseudomonas sp.]HWH85183.1 hypothetical protein [Pseudomonas sp.]
MAKSPKKVPLTTKAELPDTAGSGSPTRSNSVGLDMLDYLLLGIEPTPANGSPDTSAAVERPPAVIVHELPPTADEFSATRSATAWPPERFHELVPLPDNSGLFTGPDQRTYAHIAGEGRFMVEQDPHGNYHLPLTFAPGVPGLALVRNEGQASWRIQRPDPQSIRPAPAPPTYLTPSEANSLTQPELATDGIRYNKLRQTFVTTVDGTVMVRKNKAGEYQQAFASTREAPEVYFEQIPGTLFWRQKISSTKPEETPSSSRPPIARTEEPIAGPSKRPRLDEPAEPATSQPALVQDQQTPYHWLSWGHFTKLAGVESVQLGGLHYPIVPVGSNSAANVYFVRHPEFVPTHFEAFENMLVNAPMLQPVATSRIGSSLTEIHPGKRFFEEPITQSVARAFPQFSDATARAVAKRMFELADHSPTITGTGLVNIQAALHQWLQQPLSTTPMLPDPISMLAVAPDIDLGGKRLIPMPPQVDSELRRLTFDPQRFAPAWNHYTTYPSDLNLRRLLRALLLDSGYELFPLTYEHRKPTLVFKLAEGDQIFFLKLGSIDQAGLTHVPGNELNEPSLPTRVGQVAFKALTEAAAQSKVVWLIGGVLKVADKPDSVFILRER